jgi:hypothetical protein
MRPRLAPAEDQDVGKLPLLAVAMGLLLTARCYSADVAGIPFLSGGGATTPAYVQSIGTPVAVELPESDLAKWFPAEAPDGIGEAATWAQIEQFVTVGGTADGWAAVCKKFGEQVGAERAAKAEFGALACSSDASVTQIQHTAREILGVRANLALFVLGAPNGTVGAVQARQAQLRVTCGIEPATRGEAIAAACEQALDATYLEDDGRTSFAAAGEAYAAIAAEIARLDPTVDPEPGTFAPAKQE